LNEVMDDDTKRRTRSTRHPWPPGPAGPTGASGSRGATGARGAAGSKGITGARRERGEKGGGGGAASFPAPVRQQLSEIELTIEDIYQELDVQMKRMAQIQQQVDDLRGKIKLLTAQSH
jgi:hypothetical protein